MWPAYFSVFFFFFCSYWLCEEVLPHLKIRAGGSRRRSKICRLDQNSSTFKRNNRLSPPLPLFLSVCVFLNPTFSHRDTQSARRKRFIFSFLFFALFPLLLTQPPSGEQRISATVFFFSIAQRNVQFKEFIGSTFLPVWGKLNTLTRFVFFAVTVSRMSVEEE